MALAPSETSVSKSSLPLHRTGFCKQNVGSGDGRIPPGILAASMTSVRLSFRGFWGNARSGAFGPPKLEPSPCFKAVLAHAISGHPRPEPNVRSLNQTLTAQSASGTAARRREHGGCLRLGASLIPCPLGEIPNRRAPAVHWQCRKGWVESTSTVSALLGQSLHFRNRARASVWGGAGSP